MSKILGLDLGTNSIGWAIRDTDETENQFATYLEERIWQYNVGVVIFKKGVGKGKSGEFSLAAERRKNRSKRRLYNAKRYRKWATLKALLEKGMCPLTEEELRLWSIGNWEEVDGKKKNKGRIYPSSPDFMAWLVMDEKYFGNKGKIKNRNGEESYIRKSPYDLRFELLDKFEDDNELRKYKLGRAFYHLVQRRGFKSSRKTGKEGSFGKDEEYENWKSTQENPSVSKFYIDKLARGERIRGRKPMKREYVVNDDFKNLCKVQKLNDSLTQKIEKAIYFVRPLGSQKGLVGKCTLEKDKSRIPISHPAYEEFRALSFVNNIQWRETGSKKAFKSIPIKIKTAIFKELFFKPLERGNNKGKINDRGYFEFKEIVDRFSKNHKYEFNYAKYRNDQFELLANPNVSACPLIAGLMNVFDEEWQNKFIEDENSYGINWKGLLLSYDVKYESDLYPRNLNYIDIWHLLFDYIQTKDKEEDLQAFCKNILKWDDKRTDEFSSIGISQGYGSLSYCAIQKILPFLQDGFIYSEAVSFANLNSVLGKENFASKKDEIKKSIVKTIEEINRQKELLNITNGLIQQFFVENPTNRAKGVDERIKEMAADETDKKLKSYFGESNWDDKTADDRIEYEKFVLTKYLRFLNGQQDKEEKASAAQNKNPEIDYYKLPRLDEAIKQTLRNKFDATEAGLKKLYHPSDIDIYKKISVYNEKLFKEKRIKVKQLEDPNPPSKGWKNPMAMRTMYELRKLINYLLETEKINEDTKIVVEMARENNDANYRKAYMDWITDRDNENKEYAKTIAEMLGNVNIDNISDDDYNKFRSAIEQITEQELSENKGNIFLQKYKEFIETYLSRNSNETDDNTANEDGRQFYDYLMYLILCRDEFAKYLNFKLPNSTKWQKQILKTSANYSKKRKELQEMLIKYRLWKQQKFLCLYTGNLIPFTQLFSNDYQIEHTIPRSISFDSELKNLTVCDAVYNNSVKNNQFPTQCPNYSKTATVKTIHGLRPCTPIEERVNKYIKPKVDELNERIKNLQRIVKKIPDWEKSKKDANIQLRHYLKFELEYWEKKLLTFTVKRNGWKDGWKNSQLIDTQIITKYARAYLKTVFNKVDVQKGSITAEFRKIYEIMGDEKKDRSKHSHHAVDAAVLALIPGSARREDILRKAYEYFEQTRKQYHEKPYDKFSVSYIQTIENNILINHVGKDQTTSESKRNVRKRGEIEYLKEKETKQFIKNNGNKIPLKMQGDSIRGQLHLESYFGAIKPNERNKDGFPIKENGKYLVKQKDSKDVIWLTKREEIEKAKLEDIIDPLLRNHIQNQLTNGIKINEIVDFNNKRIRHVRCQIRSLTSKKALYFKNHVFKSKYMHKRQYIAGNPPGSNYLNILYEGVNSKDEILRAYRILSLFEFSELGLRDADLLKQDNAYKSVTKGKGKNAIDIFIKRILKVGNKVIMWHKSKDELEKLSIKDIYSRTYSIYKINNQGSDYNYLQHHLEARPDGELGDGDTLFNPEKYQPRLKLTADNFNCVIENQDFKILNDGSIIWL